MSLRVTPTPVFGALLVLVAWFGATPSRAQNFSVQSIIRVGASPQYAAISHDGSRLFVANSGGDSLSVIDNRTGRTQEIAVGKRPHGLLLSHDGRRLYVLIDLAGQNDPCPTKQVAIVILDAASLQVVQTVPVEGRTDAMALTPDDKQLYIARVCHEVDYFNLPSQELHVSLASQFNSGGLPVGILISPDGQRMFVNYQGGGPSLNGVDYNIAHDALVQYDLATGNIVRLQHSLPNVGDQVALSPDGAQVWTNGVDACSRPDYDHTGCPSVPSRVVNALRVSVNPQTTLTPLKTFDLSQLEFNGRISISPQGEVFIGGGIYLKRIDPHSLQIVQRIDIAGAGDVVFSPDGLTAYVTQSSMNAVVVLARGKPANPEAQSRAAALPIPVVNEVVLRQNLCPSGGCQPCPPGDSKCVAERTPTEVSDPLIGDNFTSRGVVNGPSAPVYKKDPQDEWPCSLHEQDPQLLLSWTLRRDENNLLAFQGKASRTNNGVQYIPSEIADQAESTRFLKNLGNDVYLATVVCSDRVETALFQRPGPAVLVSQPVTRDTVRTLVTKFRGELTNPCSSLDEIKKTGQALYDIIFPPEIVAALRKKHPTTLAWGVRDQLRYIPMGALWDGSEFLVQRYGSAFLTPYSGSGPGGSGRFLALAAGDSNNDGTKTNGLPVLKYVPDEIQNIFESNARAGNDKRIPATILLDSQSYEEFSPTSLHSKLQDLEQTGYPKLIVHLASHFVLEDTAADSYLLTQTGKLSFSDLSDKTKYSFDGVWLATLSACETGYSRSKADGSEVESFASVADRDGAESTVATLWDVMDASTGQLMQNFYSNLLANTPKGEALRLAQISQLQDTALKGTYTYKAGDGSGKSCPAYYSHPFFWAPFVLIGNWH